MVHGSASALTFNMARCGDDHHDVSLPVHVQTERVLRMISRYVTSVTLATPSGENQMKRLLVDMNEIANQLFTNVDNLFSAPAARMFYTESTYGRVAGLAALGHLCHGVEHLQELANTDGDRQLSNLVTRHQLETWGVGICLVLGGDEERSLFLGEARRMELSQKRERVNLIEAGVLPKGFEHPPEEFSSVESKKWGYPSIFRRAAELLLESGIATGTSHLYETIYRPLSNRLGAHPTPFVFDHYFSAAGNFVRVFRQPDYEGADVIAVSQAQLNFFSSVVTATIYGVAAAQRLGADRAPFDSLMSKINEHGEDFAAMLESRKQ